MTTKLMRVYGALREEILDGRLPPGERLVLHELAARLGVSPIPVREALRLLERDDLVEVEPHTKVAVRALPVAEALWAAELRAHLEPVAARDATDRLDEGQLAGAGRALAELRLWLGTDHSPGLRASYTEFHDIIFAATPNRRLVRAISESRLVGRRFRAVYQVETMLPGVEHDLADVLHALEARDPAAVFAAVTDHRRRALAQLRRRLEEWGQREDEPCLAAVPATAGLDPLIKLW